MTNLEALRLLSAEGMAEFIAGERMLALKVLSEDEELKTIGYDFDIDEMERNLKKTTFNWLLQEYPYI